jgi:hypothetical protein
MFVRPATRTTGLQSCGGGGHCSGRIHRTPTRWRKRSAPSPPCRRHGENQQPPPDQEQRREGHRHPTEHHECVPPRAAARARAHDEAEGHGDAETLGMLARTAKDLGLREPAGAARTAHFTRAFGLYERAYEGARRGGASADAIYAGVNAATMAVLLGNAERARIIATQVHEIAGKADPGKGAAAYWREAKKTDNIDTALPQPGPLPAYTMESDLTDRLKDELLRATPLRVRRRTLQSASC